MKYNKGFAPALVLLIILGIAAVGGGAYYVGKSSKTVPSNVENNSYSQGNTNPSTVVNNTTINTTPVGCTSTSKPSITVISPNGGEIFTAGQQISVSWKGCNLPTPWVSISLQKDNGTDTLLTNSETKDDGSEILTLPSTLGYYKIRIGHASAKVQQDLSDTVFTIK